MPDRYSVSLTEWNVRTILKALAMVGRRKPPPKPVEALALKQAYEAVRLQCLQQERAKDERKANAEKGV